MPYADLARAAGVHETTLHRWRSGRGHPSRVFVERVADLEAVVTTATQVFGAGSPTLRQWLETPQRILGGQAPAALLREGRAAFVKAALSVASGGLMDRPEASATQASVSRGLNGTARQHSDDRAPLLTGREG